MKNVHVAFEAWEEGSLDNSRRGQKLAEYQEIRCDIIFDINMDGKCKRNTRYVAGGQTPCHASSILYYRVVSRHSIIIAFTLSSLNDVEIRAADICNAYLNKRCRKKIWTVAGTEFGSEKVKVMLVVRTLYVLKSYSTAWRQLLAQTLRGLCYISPKTDTDIWLKAETKHDGTEYHAYVLVYVNDLLHLHHNPDTFMDRLAEVYRLNYGSVGEPGRYLGVSI